MLCSSDSDVLSIMNYVGYKDSKYFYNEFKKRYGLTPSIERSSLSKSGIYILMSGSFNYRS